MERRAHKIQASSLRQDKHFADVYMFFFPGKSYCMGGLDAPKSRHQGVIVVVFGAKKGGAVMCLFGMDV